MVAKWKTKGGVEIPIADMSDKYLENTILMLVKKAEVQRVRGVVFVSSCPDHDGQKAQNVLDKEFDRAIDNLVEIGDPSYGMPRPIKPKPTTGKVSSKLYKCTRCGHESMISTNHWGEIYPRCSKCSWKNPMDPFVTHVCLEEMPPGYDKPEPWKKVKLGDLLK